jgi:hypothetical protein
MPPTNTLPRRIVQTPSLNKEGLASMDSLVTVHSRIAETFAAHERPLTQQFADVHENWVTSDPLTYGPKLKALATGDIPDEFHAPLADYLVVAREQNLPNRGFAIFPWLAKAARGRIATRINNDLIKTGKITLTLDLKRTFKPAPETFSQPQTTRAVGRVSMHDIITGKRPESIRPLNRKTGAGVRSHRTPDQRRPGVHRAPGRRLFSFSERRGKHAEQSRQL